MEASCFIEEDTCINNYDFSTYCRTCKPGYFKNPTTKTCDRKFLFLYLIYIILNKK